MRASFWLSRCVSAFFAALFSAQSALAADSTPAIVARNASQDHWLGFAVMGFIALAFGLLAFFGRRLRRNECPQMREQWARDCHAERARENVLREREQARRG